ncbi:hypothetical protein JCM33374_g5109 [Metschnikowia sp. JCM 33374]|nr:hypothetical protein JCM33374_g5109 [Metschnikowia sp. JCM 33374]
MELDEAEKQSGQAEKQAGQAEKQAGQAECREKRQIECLDERQPKRQKNDHSRHLYYLKKYYANGDLYEFLDCCDELIPLYGTEKFEPLRQKIIEREWRLPFRALEYYYVLLGVKYEYPASMDPPY